MVNDVRKFAVAIAMAACSLILLGCSTPSTTGYPSDPGDASLHVPLGIALTTPPPSQTPVFNTTQEFNVGINTPAGAIGNDLSRVLLTPNSPPAKSWSITTNDTNGFWETKYDQTISTTTGCNNTAQTLSSTPVVANDNCKQTSEFAYASTGYNFAVNDVISGSDGSCLTVTAISDSNGNTYDPSNDFPGFPIAMSIQHQANAGTYLGVGAVTAVADNGNGCPTSTTYGTGFSATVYPATYLQLPVPTATGAKSDVGYDRTCSAGSCVVAHHAVSFAVTVVGLDNSTATETINYNLVPDAANNGCNGRTANGCGPSSASTVGGCQLNTTGNTRTCNTSLAAVGGLQQFVHNCLNCQSTGGYNSGGTGDMKVLVSSGSVFSNPDFSGYTPMFQYSVLNWAFESARQLGVAQSNPEPTVTPTLENVRDVLTWEEAERATGTLLNADWATSYPAAHAHQGPAFYSRDSVAGGSLPEPHPEWVIVNGSSAGGDCSTQPVTTTQSSGLNFSGFSWGLSTIHHYITGTWTGSIRIGANNCDIYVDHGRTGWAAAYDASNSLLSAGTEFNSGSQAFTYASGAGLRYRFTYLDCDGTGQCAQDNASSTANVGATDVVFDHIWNSHYCQNGWRPGQSNAVFMNTYSVFPQYCYGTFFHPDYVQLSDSSTGNNSTWLNNLMATVGGITYDQGFFGGRASLTGPQVHNQIQAAWSFTMIKKGGGADSLSGTQNAQVTGLSGVPFKPQFVILNAGMASIGPTLPTNPSNGQHIGFTATICPGPSFQVGCVTGTEAILTFTSACSDQTGHTGGANPDPVHDVCIGASAAATFANLAYGLGPAVNTYQNRCSTNPAFATAMGAYFGMCAFQGGGAQMIMLDPYTNNFGSTGVFDVGDSPFVCPGTGCGLENIHSDAVIGNNYGLNLRYDHWRNDGTKPPSTSACDGVNIYICGSSPSHLFLWDKNEIPGGLNDGTAGVSGSYPTVVSVIQGLTNTAVMTFTNDNVLGQTFNLFAGDSSTNTAEMQLEAVSAASYNAMSAKSLITFIKGVTAPKTGGLLDISGGAGAAIGSVDFLGHWTTTPDGQTYSYGPGDDIQTSSGSNPWFQ